MSTDYRLCWFWRKLEESTLMFVGQKEATKLKPQNKVPSGKAGARVKPLIAGSAVDFQLEDRFKPCPKDEDHLRN